jgi:hypothetical protein
LAIDGSNYLLWAKTAKAHIHPEELCASIAFDEKSIVSILISIFF